MADEQSREIVRELRWIRLILAGIFLVLISRLCQVEINRWQDSHYATPKVSQEFRDAQGEARAIQKGAGDQRSQRP
jgi:hypothetical protein